MSYPPLRFGVFLAPYHKLGQNPSLLLQRDLELIRHMDRLGYDEAWIGEHHSGGWEIIASPEVFIAHALAQTRDIRFGTGVLSLPYHHPLMVADRIVLLDHLARGRVSFGFGPGQLTSDAHMMGIDTSQQRRMMGESLEAIVRLLEGEVVSCRSDWFQLQDARLQLRPWSQPNVELAVAASISPAGPQLAGRFGAAMLSVAATREQGFDAVGYHWSVLEESARLHGRQVDRRQWRLTGPMHLAESVEQAKKDVRFGLLAYEEYLRQHVMYPEAPDMPLDEYIDGKNATGSMIIGTPEMAIRQLERLQEQSGGFGCYLFSGIDLADFPATLRSYELFAQEVMPHFQGQIKPLQDSHRWTTEHSERWTSQTASAIGKAMEEYGGDEGSGPGLEMPEPQQSNTS